MGRRKITTEEFIARGREKHGDKYLYDKAVYIGALDKIEIGCRIHGYFWQFASTHYKSMCYSTEDKDY